MGKGGNPELTLNSGRVVNWIKTIYHQVTFDIDVSISNKICLHLKFSVKNSDNSVLKIFLGIAFLFVNWFKYYFAQKKKKWLSK